MKISTKKNNNNNNDKNNLSLIQEDKFESFIYKMLYILFTIHKT